MIALTAKTPAMAVILGPDNTVLPSTTTNATIGVPAPITSPAMVRQVDNSARSFGSLETAETMDP